MVVIDRLTKFSHFIPCVEAISSREVADLFVRQIFRIHGVPRDITSDRDTRFISAFWTEFTKLLGIKRNLSTSYQPQTDGQVERTNQTLEVYLRALCSDTPTEWSNVLPYAEFAYNNSLQSAIKMSPFRATYGFDPPFGLPSNTSSKTPQAEQFVIHMANLHNLCKKHMELAQVTAKKIYDRSHRSAPDLQPGDFVFIRNTHMGVKAPSGKLAPKRIGPFRVSEQISNLAYRIQLPKNFRIHDVFHVSKLTPTEEIPEVERQQEVSTPLQPLIPTSPKIDKILNQRGTGSEIEYLVHYENTHPDENTWVKFDEAYQNNHILVRQHVQNRESKNRDDFLLGEEDSVRVTPVKM